MHVHYYLCEREVRLVSFSTTKSSLHVFLNDGGSDNYEGYRYDDPFFFSSSITASYLAATLASAA